MEGKPTVPGLAPESSPTIEQAVPIPIEDRETGTATQEIPVTIQPLPPEPLPVPAPPTATEAAQTAVAGPTTVDFEAIVASPQVAVPLDELEAAAAAHFNAQNLER